MGQAVSLRTGFGGAGGAGAFACQGPDFTRSSGRRPAASSSCGSAAPRSSRSLSPANPLRSHDRQGAVICGSPSGLPQGFCPALRSRRRRGLQPDARWYECCHDATRLSAPLAALSASRQPRVQVNLPNFAEPPCARPSSLLLYFRISLTRHKPASSAQYC